MLRLLSALVLLPAVAGAVWFLDPLALMGVAGAVVVLAFVEFTKLAARLDAEVPVVAGAAAAVAACAATARPDASVAISLFAALVALAALAAARALNLRAAVAGIGAAMLGIAWLALPLGMLVAVRTESGRGAVLLLLATVIASDTAQYYVGVTLGRHRLAPSISPKKTIEGAIGGLIGGLIATLVGGRALWPSVGSGWLAALGVALVALGILGDLFESLVKRAAGVKDSSGVIPGHGGVLDRLDALLFAVPAFLLFVRHVLPSL